MTLIALILGILLGTVSLAIGYGQGGAPDLSRWFLLLAGLWLFAHFRKWYGFSSLALVVIVLAAAYGVWLQYPAVWMLLGAVGGLLGWDLSDFARRLSYASPMDDTRGMELRHLERVGIVAALGLATMPLKSVLLAATPLANFIHANPTIVMLALGFLLLIGTTLIAEGFGAHVPKGYIYAAMAFSAFIEMLNILARRARKSARDAETPGAGDDLGLDRLPRRAVAIARVGCGGVRSRRLDGRGGRSRR